jgi:hypothetical protein
VAPFVSGGAAVAYQTGCWVDAADASVVAPRMTCRSYDRSPFSGGPIERRRVDASALVGGGVTVPAAGRRLRLSALYDRSVRRTDPAIPTEHRAWYYLASVEW